jgi:hypothetical protein
MLRNSTGGLRSVQIGSLAFAAMLIAAFALPALASGVTNLSEQLPEADQPYRVSVTPEDLSEETIRIPIWIPGFDDVEPPLTCLRVPGPNSVKHSAIRARHPIAFSGTRRFEPLSGVDSCRGIHRILPWISPPVPTGPSLTAGL